jgi:hypothetical protein
MSESPQKEPQTEKSVFWQPDSRAEAQGFVTFYGEGEVAWSCPLAHLIGYHVLGKDKLRLSFNIQSILMTMIPGSKPELLVGSILSGRTQLVMPDPDNLTEIGQEYCNNSCKVREVHFEKNYEPK